MLAFLFPCPGRYPEGKRGTRPRHASPAPPVRLAAGTLQEEHPARAGLAHHHHRGHRRDGVRHPQRGESTALTAPPPGGGVTLCQPCALFFPQDEKNQVLTTYIWYRQVSRGDLCQIPLSLGPGCCSRGWSTGGDWAGCLPAGHDCPGLSQGKAGCCHPALMFAYLNTPVSSPGEKAWCGGTFGCLGCRNARKPWSTDLSTEENLPCMHTACPFLPLFALKQLPCLLSCSLTSVVSVPCECSVITQ